MRVDAHQHFWRYRSHESDCVWMTDDQATLRRDFGPPDHAPLLAAAGIDGSIAVQAREMPVETDYLLDLAVRCSFVRGVAKPDIRGGRLEAWRQAIAALAQRPNVCSKLSSVITQADRRGWSHDGLHPFLDQALECFGSIRLMVGSDWPVSTMAAEFATTIGVFSRWAAHLREWGRRAVFGGSAVRFHRLEEPSS